MRGLARLGAMRARAESRMASTATIRRRTGTWTTVADRKVPGWQVVESAVPMRLGGADRGASGSRTVATPGGDVETAVRVASFPHGKRYADGDFIDITAGENAGLVLRIVDATSKDQATAYRVPVVEERRPEEWS